MSEQTDILTRFASWVRTATPTVETTEYVTIDQDYDPGTVTTSIDLGVAGSDVEVEVEVGEVNVYLQQVEVEASVEVDVEQLINDEAPVSSRALLDALDAAVEALDAPAGRIPTSVDVREEMAGRAALAAVRVLLDGDGDDAVRRALGDALVRAGYRSTPDIGYDPLTVERSTGDLYGTAVEELRLGDDILGGSFGIVMAVEPTSDPNTFRVTLNRDGFERVETYSRGLVFTVSPVAPPNATRAATPTAVELATDRVAVG